MHDGAAGLDDPRAVQTTTACGEDDVALYTTGRRVDARMGNRLGPVSGEAGGLAAYSFRCERGTQRVVRQEVRSPSKAAFKAGRLLYCWMAWR